MAISTRFNISDTVTNPAKTSASSLPTFAFPTDARTYFESYADALAAAKTAKQQGSTDSIYYFGLIVSVYSIEDETVSVYVIIPDKINGGGKLGKIYPVTATVVPTPTPSETYDGWEIDGGDADDAIKESNGEKELELIVDGLTATEAAEGFNPDEDDIVIDGETSEEAINGFKTDGDTALELEQEIQDLVDEIVTNPNLDDTEREEIEQAIQDKQNELDDLIEGSVDGSFTVDRNAFSADSTLGDANDDGKVNNKDLGVIMQYIQGWDMSDSINLQNADVNKDGVVNAIDYGILMRYLNNWDELL